MVFQSYALYPHMTVRRNIEFPLQTRKVRRRTSATSSVREAARDRSASTSCSTASPAQLSGGQRQRVALARGDRAPTRRRS